MLKFLECHQEWLFFILTQITMIKQCVFNIGTLFMGMGPAFTCVALYPIFIKRLPAVMQFVICEEDVGTVEEDGALLFEEDGMLQLSNSSRFLGTSFVALEVSFLIWGCLIFCLSALLL